MKVSIINVPIFRANAFANTYLMRQSVGDQFSQAYLIIPDNMAIRGKGFEIDLEKEIPKNLIHVVVASDGVPHAEPYLPAEDCKSKYTFGPFQIYIRIPGYKISDDGMKTPIDSFLELWDDVPFGLERPGLRAETKFIVAERTFFRFPPEGR